MENTLIALLIIAPMATAVLAYVLLISDNEYSDGVEIADDETSGTVEGKWVR